MLAAIIAALVSSISVAPAMTVIDTAIIRAQFAKESLSKAILETVKALRSGKAQWNPALRIMSGVYMSTYMTANVSKVVCTDFFEIDYKVPTALCTSIVNVAAIAYKDQQYAKLYSQSAAAFPKLSYGLFTVRDGFTITASFIVKHDVKRALQNDYGMSHNQADLVSSFSVPMVAQLFSTPVHILALDLYSRPKETFVSRMRYIGERYVSVCAGRAFRIIPAFGIGGYLNDMIMENIRGREEI